MRILNTLSILTVTGLLWTGCSTHREAEQPAASLSQSATGAQSSEADTTAADALMAEERATPVEAPAPLKRQFVRTADVKCRVTDVVKVTERIETLVARQGGFVTHTALDSENNGAELVPISADSSLETTQYTISSTLTLRVPNTGFDSTLRAITQLADLVEHRAINADDVALQLLAADQTRRRNAAYDQRLRRAIDSRGRRLGETIGAEESRLTQQAQTDEARREQYDLYNQLHFSTLTLALYQRPVIRRVVLASLPDTHAYEPGFLTQATEALVRGGYVLKQFVLLLLEGWGLIAFAVGGYVLYRYGLNRRKRMAQG